MKRITAVVLDVDGTVVTCPYDFAAMRAAIGTLATTYGVEASAFPQRGALEQVEAITEHLGTRGEQFRLSAENAIETIELSTAAEAVFIPGAAEALHALRAQGLAIALITRNCRLVAERVLGAFDGYDVLLTRNDVPKTKPDPDHVLRALAHVGCAPDTAAMIGDHAFDMQAGHAAHLRLCIGVRTGNSSDESLLSAGAKVVLDSLADFPAWLAHYEGER